MLHQKKMTELLVSIITITTMKFQEYFILKIQKYIKYVNI
jgi:hypothetical protein